MLQHGAVDAFVGHPCGGVCEAVYLQRVAVRGGWIERDHYHLLAAQMRVGVKIAAGVGAEQAEIGFRSAVYHVVAIVAYPSVAGFGGAFEEILHGRKLAGKLVGQRAVGAPHRVDAYQYVHHYASCARVLHGAVVLETFAYKFVRRHHHQGVVEIAYLHSR